MSKFIKIPDSLLEPERKIGQEVVYAMIKSRVYSDKEISHLIPMKGANALNMPINIYSKYTQDLVDFGIMTPVMDQGFPSYKFAGYIGDWLWTTRAFIDSPIPWQCKSFILRLFNHCFTKHSSYGVIINNLTYISKVTGFSKSDSKLWINYLLEFQYAKVINQNLYIDYIKLKLK